MKDKILRLCDAAKDQAEKNANDLIGRIKEDGIDMQRSHLIELHRILLTRDIFLDHPFWWAWNRVVVNISALKIKIIWKCKAIWNKKN